MREESGEYTPMVLFNLSMDLHLLPLVAGVLLLLTIKFMGTLSQATLNAQPHDLLLVPFSFFVELASLPILISQEMRKDFEVKEK